MWEKQYIDIVKEILENGVEKKDRTGTGTKSIFGAEMRVDLSKEFPATTCKKLFMKPVISELLWFLEGSTDERRLAEILYGKDRTELIGKKTIWTANADAQGKSLGYMNTDLVKELGPVYGYQWRYWNTFKEIKHYDDDNNLVAIDYNLEKIDQISNAIKMIKENPDSRRNIVSAWNVSDLHKMALPPCHNFFQILVVDGKLNLSFNMRSNDFILGNPFNMASYALLAHMLANVSNLEVGELVFQGTDVHIYLDHLEGAAEMCERELLPAPTLNINTNVKDIFGFHMNDFSLQEYASHDSIKFKMAV